jgi:patatin-like phospholipase/acyl hydrolase
MINNITDSSSNIKYILSLDGGGVRGIATLSFLKRFEEHYNVQCSEFFDFFAGTSIGGLIGLTLSSGKTASETLDAMLENLGIVMNKSFWDKILPCQCRPIYNGKGKKRAIKNFVPDIPLSEFPKHILIPTYDITNRRTILHCPDSDQISARILADATTAAPSYFPPVLTNCIDKKKIYEIDGGVAVNHPALIALTHVMTLDSWKDTEIKVLSIGTGMDSRHISGLSARKWGAVEWATNGITNIFVQAPNQVFNQACTDLIGDNYLRINSAIQSCGYKIDNTSKKNVQCLIKMGSDWFDEYQERIDEWMAINVATL